MDAWLVNSFQEGSSPCVDSNVAFVDEVDSVAEPTDEKHEKKENAATWEHFKIKGIIDLWRNSSRFKA